MEKTEGKFKSTNDIDTITYYKYMPSTEIKAIFQIVHGMAEHVSRYEPFIKYLCDNGYAVYAHEHIGHGSSVKNKEQLGTFVDDKQNNVMIEDTKRLSEIAKSDLPDKKIVLFGHSMGSFIVRLYAAKYSNQIDGLVVCGTGGSNSASGVGKALIKTIKLFKGKDYKSKFVDKMSFGSFTKKYENPKTNFDWLSRDENIVNKYIRDDYCGYLFTLDGMLILLKLNVSSCKKSAFEAVRSDLPIFIISGDMDPVGDYGKGVKSVYNSYISASKSNVKMKLYHNARHEILNELEKDVTYDDILKFANSVI